MRYLGALGTAMVCSVLTACGGGGSSGSGVSGQGYSPYACNSALYEKAKELRIYQVMTEAYIDTDGAGYGVGYGTSHHRGDIQGVINSLEYIQSLGMNAIWLTPVFESVSLSGQDLAADRLDATGYFATNYFSIDPNFGSLDDARELVNKAHDLGMYVFFDGVFGHFKENAHNYVSPKGISVSRSGKGQASTGREAVYPDDLDFFKEVATYWVSELKIDGWRLDQAYQVPTGAWGEIRQAVENTSASVSYQLAGETVNPLGYMVAEIWDGESGIASNGYGETSAPGLCSAFDFPMRYRIVQAFAGEEGGYDIRNASTLNDGFATHNVYPSHAVPNGFITNHDLVRFGDLLQREGLADPSDSTYWSRYQAVYAFLSAYTGPITLYYGEEIGDQVDGFDDKVTGDCVSSGLCDDHVARSTAKIESLASEPGASVFSANANQKALRDRISGLMAIRKDHPALYLGSRKHIVSNEGEALYVDYKVAGADKVLFVVNVTESSRTLLLNVNNIDGNTSLTDLESAEELNAVGNTLTVELLPLQARFLEVSP
ncbi:glycosidase [Hahella sp. CCB-MM4]|uniref:alpha-amylase family protein n=1 Tax=Hahella sp. (strain CCB-MM4) TaxID=1926491 RepID=UPI000B9C08B3|nr:alpha-amylase family protein [Hahella sp. CCB-MM4]OZG74285.1 glycosidase [Hahella sp. CCB-MM4]